LAIVGMILLAIRARRTHLPLAGLLLATGILLSMNVYVGAASFAIAALYLSIMDLRATLAWKATCVLCSILIFLFGFFAVNKAVTSSSPQDKYHAMTRGVLLQSENPETTLDGFGISRRFSILADTYCDQSFPMVLAENGVLRKEFLDRYTTADILAYYLRNPGVFIRMLDLSVTTSYATRPDFSGNYEQSVGLPPKAKSPFMSLWSNFKVQSAPRTIAFFAILSFVVLYFFRREEGKTFRAAQAGKANGAIWNMLLALIVFSVVELATVIVFGGDALMLRESFIFSVCQDLLIVFAFSEILRNLNIMRARR